MNEGAAVTDAAHLLPANSASPARLTVEHKQNLDLMPEDVEWRFVEERPDDWSPFSDRFPQADWMEWR